MLIEMKPWLIADTKAVTSIGIASATWVADLAVWLQIGATAVAIGAGVAAAWYHIERALEKRKNRLKK